MRTATKIGLGLLGAAAFIAVWVLLCPYFWTNLVWVLRRAVFWLVPLVGLLVVGVAVGAYLVDRSDRGKRLYGLGFLAVLLGLAGVVGYFWWATSLHGYAQAGVYAASVRVVEDQVPKLGQRAPFQIASAQARPNLGDSQGEIQNNNFQPTSNQYSSLVTRRSAAGFVGYDKVLEQTVPLTGRGSGKTCSFTDLADQRVDGASVFGFFSHNLGRAISEQRRWVSFENSDVYGYCDGDTPKVVVPLKEQTGFWVVTEQPAGVAIYNGHTGAIEFRDDTKGMPGSGYPLSLAAAQREALHGMGSYGDWIANRAGWDVDSEDVNSGNNAEFTLPSADGKEAFYVTPLTGRGSATAISAMSTVSNTGRTGELAPLTVHKLSTPWLSPSAIEQRVKADFGDIPNWQLYKVLELAPTDGGHYVLTIGSDQNVVYRVQGTGNLSPDNEADCLEKVEGDQLTKIRCGTAANVNGNGPGTQYGQTTPGPGTVPTGNLSSLSNDQLAQLQRQITDEIAKRLGGH